MEEDREQDELEKKNIEQQQKKQQEIENSNKTAHTAIQSVAMAYGGPKAARIYNTASKTKVGQAAEKKIGKQIRRNPISKGISNRLNKNGTIDKANNALNSISGSGNANSATESSYETADKANVTIKLPKISLPIIIILIISFAIVFLFIFISVLLPGTGIFDDDTTSQSSHTAYLSTINSDCNSLIVNGTSIAIEDYITNVVASETNNNASYETKKALAIIARTNVIKNTNSCSQSVPSIAEDFQIYNPSITISQDTINAVKDTKSQIVFINNKLVDIQRDDFIHIKNSGKSCIEVLKEIYGEEIIIEAYSQASGLEVTDISNYLARTSRATRDNSYYYNQASGLSANGLEGECAWYGLARAQEILGTSGSNKHFSRGGNGGEFCEVAQSLSDKFTIITDYTKPQSGSLVVWKGGLSGYGHVAVIEKVIDSNTVFISEAGIGIGQFGRTATDLLWTSGSQYNATNARYGSNALARKANCEGNNSGCQSFKNVSVNTIQNYSGMNFACYIYLLDN